jgi:hypothetical protein
MTQIKNKPWALSLVLFFSLYNICEPVEATKGISVENVAQKLADDVDVFAAVEYLSRQEDLVVAMKALNALQRKAYRAKDIGRSMAFGRAGVQLGLSEGRRLAESNPDLSQQLLGQAKAMSYNLASFSWPGWDEEGIRLSTSDVVMGLDAAKVNLRLAVELKRGATPMSNAHWVLGAHYLSDNALDTARDHFQKAETFAESDSGRLLAQGYLVLTDIVASPDDAAFRPSLAGIQKKLEPLEDGPFLSEHLTTALRVFTAARS